MLKLHIHFLNILCAPYFPHAYASGLWLNVGTLFFISVKAPPPTHPCFPSHHLPRKKGHMRIYPPLPPTSKLQMLKNERRGVAAQHGNTQHPRVVLNKSSAPVTFAPLLLLLASHLHPGRLRPRRAPDLTPQNAARCDRAARSLPTICSKCVEPSVSKTGRPRFPFSLGLVSLFSGASLLPEWLLGLGSGPTKGFLKWRSWG